MGYAAWRHPGFSGGLNLRDQEDQIDPTQAIDSLNTTYTQRGSVKQRPGTLALGSAHTNAVGTLCPFYKTDGTVRLIAGCGTRLEAMDTAGGIVGSGSATGLVDGTWGFTRFGSPNNERVYAGQGNDTIRRWDETAFWTAPANMPKAGSLAVDPDSNRMVAARFNTTTGGPAAATSSPSHIYFSNAGDPETWGATDFEQLTPSDGEKIQAVVAWEGFIFAFKETKFFIFYGETADANGAVFNYRTVDTGIGALGPKAVVSAKDGVYFASRKGIYRTTGGPPELLSDLVNPIFDSSQPTSRWYQGGTLLQSQAANTALGYHNERLYVGFTSTGGSNNYTLVYDPAYGWWSLWDFPAACFASFRISSTPELVFGDTANKKVYRHNTSRTSDDGVAITSRWRSGWPDMGSDAQKTIRESKVWGSGTVSLSIAHDFQQGAGDTTLMSLNPSTATATTFGGTGTFGGDGYFGDLVPGLIPGLRRNAVRGTTFSISLSNSTLDQTWAVDRLQHHLRQTGRSPSVINTDL